MTEVTMNGDLKLVTSPSNVELERDVLGVFLIESNSFANLGYKLNSDCFHDPKNRIVFNAILSLFKAGKNIDLITVVDEIRKSKNDSVDAYYCTLLTNGIASSAHLEEWIAVLFEYSVRRSLLKNAMWQYYSAQDITNDPLELLSEASSKNDKILNSRIFVNEKSFLELFDETVSEIKEAKEKKSGVIGLQTHFDFIDRNMMGLVPPDLTIIAARPGMGKTTLAWNITLNVAKKGIPVGVFSFEMKDRQLMWKTLSHYLPDYVNNIRSGNISGEKWDRITEVKNEIKGLPIHINDSGFLNVEEMKAVTKSWINRFKIKVVIIDYLQLIPPIPELRKLNREAQVSYNSRAIKSLCMECNIPIVLLSQLSRQGENVEPELYHLRESGAIEQDADNVIFIHKNEEETERSYPGWQDGNPEWIVDILLKKSRLGGMGRRSMVFNAANNIFKEKNDPFYERVNYRDYSGTKETPF